MLNLCKGCLLVVLAILVMSGLGRMALTSDGSTEAVYTHEGVEYNCLAYKAGDMTPVYHSDQLICFKDIDTWYGVDVRPVFYIENGVYHSM